MKKLYFIFLVLVLITVMLIPAGAAQAASKQMAVEGTVTFSFVPGTFVTDKVVGGPDAVIWDDSIVMATFLFDVTYTGDISGTAQESETARWNTKQGDYPLFKFNSIGLQEFTGSILGKTGTFTARTRHQGYPDGHVRVEQTIVSGTGELANLHGTLIFDVYFQYELVHTGTYSGKLHLAP